jgi:hypothetical protein
LGTSEESWGVVDSMTVEHTVVIIQQVLYHKCLLVQIWDKSDLSYSVIKSGSTIDRYGV